MDASNWTDQLAAKLPGILGGACSFFWMQGPWYRKLGLCIGGGIASIYISGPMAAITGMDAGLSGFATGLFSMAVADMGFRTFQALALGPLIMERLRSWLGLPPKHLP